MLGLRGHKGMCGWVAFTPDPGGWRLASASMDGTIRVWELARARRELAERGLAGDW